jgi:hypothetical protein
MLQRPGFMDLSTEVKANIDGRLICNKRFDFESRLRAAYSLMPFDVGTKRTSASACNLTMSTIGGWNGHPCHMGRLPKMP